MVPKTISSKTLRWCSKR